MEAGAEGRWGERGRPFILSPPSVPPVGQMICLAHTERVWEDRGLSLTYLILWYFLIHFLPHLLWYFLPSSFSPQQYLALKSAAKECFFFSLNQFIKYPFFLAKLKINHFLSGCWFIFSGFYKKKCKLRWSDYGLIY